MIFIGDFEHPENVQENCKETYFKGEIISYEITVFIYILKENFRYWCMNLFVINSLNTISNQ